MQIKTALIKYVSILIPFCIFCLQSFGQPDNLVLTNSAQKATCSNLVGTWRGLIDKDTVFFDVYKNREIIARVHKKKSRYFYQLRSEGGEQHIYINAIDTNRNVALDQLIRIKNDSVILIQDGNENWQTENDFTTRVFVRQKIFSQSNSNKKDTLTINGVKFQTFKKVIRNEYDSKDTVLEIYQLKNGKPILVVKHYLYRKGADAENEFEDIGTIQIKNDSFILKTHYLQKGNDPIPEWRKQIYTVTSSGQVLLLFDKSKAKNSTIWKNTDH